MLFLGIISWKGTSRFNEGGEWGGGSDWGASFLSGVAASWGGIGFDVGGFKKNCWMRGGHAPPPQLWETLKPFNKKGFLEEMEGVNDNFSAFMHLNMKINNGKKLLFKPSRVIYVRKLSFSTSW